MVGELKADIVNAVNILPRPDRVLRTVSPRTILYGRRKPNMKMKRVSYIIYAYVYTYTDYTMETTCIPAIALMAPSKHDNS